MYKVTVDKLITAEVIMSRDNNALTEPRQVTNRFVLQRKTFLRLSVVARLLSREHYYAAERRILRFGNVSSQHVR